MPKKETVRALVVAFNVNNYAHGIIKSNFKLQSGNNKDCIIISFDRGMGNYQCEKYLHDVKRKIVHEFYNIEKNRYEMVGVVNLIFYVAYFPFNVSEEGWKVPSFLILIALDDGKPRLLKDEEAFRLNSVFNYAVFNNLNGEIQA
jgi:hypothetical protein